MGRCHLLNLVVLADFTRQPPAPQSEPGAETLPNIDLTGQQALADTIEPQLTAFVQALAARHEVWDAISPEKRAAWCNSNKDPIMSLLVGARMRQLVKAYNEAIEYQT